MRNLAFLLAVAALWRCGGLAEDGGAPRLGALADQQVVVGEKLLFFVTATDPDGDALTFKIAHRPAGAQFVALDDGRQAFFSWIPEVTDSAPGGRDHQVEFFVQDGTGQWDSALVTITVLPQQGPQFLIPAGYVLDLAEENSLEFLIQVKDDSATQVEITLVDGPAGAYLEQTGKKQSYFFWRPEPSQIAEKLFWAVRLQAVGRVSDKESPGGMRQLYQLTRDLAIVITNAGYAGCPGSAPRLEHLPPGDQHPPPGSGYAVTAQVVDDDSEVARVELFWTTGDPHKGAQYSPVKLTAVDGQHFAGTIPRQTAGAGTFIHYYLEATDNDDFAGATCDHTVRWPKEGVFSFVAYDLGHESSCLDDSFENNDSQASASSLAVPGEYRKLRLCGADQDYYRLSGGSSGVAVVVVGHGHEESLRTELRTAAGGLLAGPLAGTGSLAAVGAELAGEEPVVVLRSESGEPVTYELRIRLQSSVCEADGLEPNDSALQADLLSGGGFQWLTLCSGDVDLFRLQPAAGTLARVVLDHSAVQGDLDLHVLAADGETVVVASQGLANREQIDLFLDDSQPRFVRVAGYQGATNTYHLEVELSQHPGWCEDDLLAPNHHANQAFMAPPALFEGLTLCPGTEDWFAIGLNGGETVEVGTVPPLQVRFFEPGASEPACSSKVGGGAGPLICKALAAGNYHFSVTASSQQAIGYDLTLAVSDPPGACHDDRFENNDTAELGAPIVSPITTWLKTCGTDADWFHFAGSPLDYLFAGLYYDPAGGLIDITLYDGLEGQQLARSESSWGVWYLESELPRLGDYYLEIRAADEAANIPYNLLLWFY